MEVRTEFVFSVPILLRQAFCVQVITSETIKLTNNTKTYLISLSGTHEISKEIEPYCFAMIALMCDNTACHRPCYTTAKTDFVMSVCLSAWNNLASTGRIFMKLDI
jgi:hypothetical protein